MNGKISFIREPRGWQKKSFGKIDRCLSSGKNEIMPVNACVGSGKTDLACYAFGRFISENKAAGKRTVSVFVSPRIKLCDQQTAAIESFVDGTFGLSSGKDYKVVPVNSGDVARLTDFDRCSGAMMSEHAVFVFCDASLWGTDPDAKDPERRWRIWKKNFETWKAAGIELGAVFYDEAHNYEQNRDRIAELAGLFRLTMLASGTPARFQRDLTREWRKNACECSPSEAMRLGMIKKPSLNMIKGFADFDFPAAVAAVLKREKEICEKEPFGVAVLVNCSSIDQIKSILDHEWFDGRIGKEFHVISIHSSKTYTDGDNETRVLDSRIDGRAGVSSQEAYETIEALDGGGFGDGLPVIVFQVGMIGEGINVRCFNSVIVTTHSDRTAMQQIGRAVRNCFKDGMNKIEHGHANVYAFVENVEDLQRLIVNIQEYDLTEDCYEWGRRIDVSTGSGLVAGDPGSPGKLNEFEWSEIGELDIQEIVSAADIRSTKRNNVEFVNELIDLNPKLVEDFMNLLKGTDYCGEFMKEFDKRIRGFDGAKFRDGIERAKAERKAAAGADREDRADGKNERKKRYAADGLEVSKSFIVFHLMILRNYAKTHSIFGRLWEKEDNRRDFLTKIFGNALVGGFFAKTLTDRIIDRIVKR